MKKLFKQYWLYIVFIIIGGIGGYLYWYYIGCTSGTCPLTSKWYSSSVFGLVIGYIVGSSVHEKVNKKSNTVSEDAGKF
ncbi:MAG: hypothetical protein JXJ22_07510 [Bacteroidales bacterium]|nr:hypothetical protein [Bacteroidales bacterium]